MNKLLFFLKIPPPITGVTVINQMVLQSKLLNSSYSIYPIKIQYVNSLDDYGRFRISKLKVFIRLFIKLVQGVIITRPAFVYFQISPLGKAFYRDVFFVVLLKLMRVPIVFHLHGKGIKKAVSDKPLLKKIYYHVFNNEKLICLSQSLVSDIEDVYEGRPYIVPNAIRHKRVKKEKKSEIPHILFLSNLFHSKGVLDFIEALHLLKKENILFKAHIVGGDGDIKKEELILHIEKKNLSSEIKVHGALYNSDKEKIISGSDIFVFPTREDVWGLVLLEAMQAGLPVIATMEGAIPEIVEDGVTGLLVPKKDPQGLKEKIKYLIENSEERKTMGEAGHRKYLEKYTLEKFEQNLLNTFTAITNK